MHYDSEFTESLGILTPCLSVGYWWVEGNRLDYKGINSSGSLVYKGPLSPQGVVTALNNKTKEIFSSTFLGVDHGEGMLQAINRVRNMLGVSVQVAKGLVDDQCLPGDCVLIEGGPLDSVCYFLSSGKYFHKEIKDVLPLRVSEVITFTDSQWRLMLAYGPDSSQYISKYLVGSSDYVIEHGYYSYSLVSLSKSNKECVLKGSLEECEAMEALLRKAYANGRASITNHLDKLFTQLKES